eukprot:3126546-Prymnesium_polylepis.1
MRHTRLALPRHVVFEGTLGAHTLLARGSPRHGTLPSDGCACPFVARFAGHSLPVHVEKACISFGPK